MDHHPLKAVSPIDGRYQKHTAPLINYFSEEALIRYRIQVEIEYFIALCEIPLQQLSKFKSSDYKTLRAIYKNFNHNHALKIKDIEKVTNHDVKAVEYFIKEKFESLGFSEYKEFIHFGLTSQDINNTAVPLSVKLFVHEIYLPLLESVVIKLEHLADQWTAIPMLARTHGQPASPTRLGKEIDVFIVRIKEQVAILKTTKYAAKFGGATGNFNAHHIAYPQINWKSFGTQFIEQKLKLHYSFPTTQIEHYDHLAVTFDNLKRINTIFIDFCRDFWSYIAMDYFKQKIKEGEVGSSAMPHKVNPIDFENAEGNLGLANCIFEHLSAKLPLSRLQRDLTDSTVLRNIGVPMGHTIIALHSIQKGLEKLVINPSKIADDLNENWAVVAEAIQTILRREGYPNPYEALKDLTRTHEKVTQESLSKFINNLNITSKVKQELLKITPFNYTGI